MVVFVKIEYWRQFVGIIDFGFYLNHGMGMVWVEKMSWIVAFSRTEAVSLDNRVWSHCFVVVVYLYNSSKISFNNEDALN